MGGRSPPLHLPGRHGRGATTFQRLGNAQHQQPQRQHPQEVLPRRPRLYSKVGIICTSKLHFWVHSHALSIRPIGGNKWFGQIYSQWESQKNRFALISFRKIQFLPPCIWNLPFISTASVHFQVTIFCSNVCTVYVVSITCRLAGKTFCPLRKRLFVHSQNDRLSVHWCADRFLWWDVFIVISLAV